MKVSQSKNEKTITVKTRPDYETMKKDWWNAQSNKDICAGLLTAATYLKDQGQYKFRKANMYASLYGNQSLFSWFGSSNSKLSQNKGLSIDRPTMNVVSSCVDTLVSRLAQSTVKPVFLTDDSDYEQRTLAKQLNGFMDGEIYQTKLESLITLCLRDAAVLGTGVLKVVEDTSNRVSLERKLMTEVYVDENDGAFGSPRQMYEMALVDRELLSSMFPKNKSIVNAAEQSFVDQGSSSVNTISDLVMVVEGWRLPSKDGDDDGMHAIACSDGLLFDEKWTSTKFPFKFLHYTPMMRGFWGQSLAEQLMGTQIEINRILVTISKSINLVGVPRIFVEDGSKIVKAHLNDMIGSIITYSGTPPIYSVAPCVPVEMYSQLERLVQYAYQQSGISALSASSVKPKGLSSGEALRAYDDIQTDRFASLQKRVNDFRVDVCYGILDKAIEIADRDGKYQTIFPNKDGVREIDLPKISEIKDNPFVIQSYDMSSLPKDPAGRLQHVIEMMQAGIISPQEGRRLISFPDISQIDKLENASEERIFKQLDLIVEKGEFEAPDQYTNLELAEKFVDQYFNLYQAAKLTDERLEMLSNYKIAVNALKMQMSQALGPQTQQPMPQGVPESRPVNPMLPQV